MLIGKAIIRGEIETKTGLRIGGSDTGLKIGGVDLNVVIDPEGKPYIPGSSLKGKLRSLIERKENVRFSSKSGLHSCGQCDICLIWGAPGTETSSPTRLVVRDANLDKNKFQAIKDKGCLPQEWTEIKTEINIDRTTGTVSKIGGPREVERVPAGAVFCFELIYNVFDEHDKHILKKVFEAMELLEDDYLGGMGSRGYGQVKFNNIKIYWNTKADYEAGNIEPEEKQALNGDLVTPSQIVKNFSAILEKLPG